MGKKQASQSFTAAAGLFIAKALPNHATIAWFSFAKRNSAPHIGALLRFSSGVLDAAALGGLRRVYLSILNLPMSGSSFALPFSALIIPMTASIVITILRMGAINHPRMGIIKTTDVAKPPRNRTRP